MIPRINKKEIMDNQNIDEKIKVDEFKELARLNRLFGINKLVLKYTKKFLSQNKINSIIDIGTGAGDLPLYFLNWSKKNNIDLDITAIDIDPISIKYAKENFGNGELVKFKQASVEDIEESFDIAIISQVLHHIDQNDILEFLQNIYLKTNKAIIISDFIRSRTSYWFVKLLLWIFTKNKISRHDGSLSILRSYSDHELKSIFKKINISKFYIYNHFPRKIIIIYK